MMDRDPEGLLRSLQAFGATPHHVRLLDEETLRPQQLLDYADLLALGSRPDELKVGAVVEVDDRPVIYVVSRPLLSPPGFEDRLNALHRKLSCRGQETYLAVADQGRLTIYLCALRRGMPRPMIDAGAGDAEAAGIIPSLVQGSFWQDRGRVASDRPSRRGATHSRAAARARTLAAEAKSVHDVLLDSIVSVATTLQSSDALAGRADASALILALVGRTLLLRFLADRHIVTSIPEDEVPGVRHQDVRCAFDSAAAAASACAWLDETFNGDLLRLPLVDDHREAFVHLEERDASFFRTLGCLMRAEEDGQLRLPLWGQLDFAHVPVGLLSEVYDDFSRHVSPKNAKSTSVHFTPASIADYLLSQALGAVQSVAPADARVLDPAVGAGIFLTIAFRRLYAAHWSRNLSMGGARPGTAAIREILYGQLCGFDINPDALTLAALSLYLTAIELDPEPFPPQKLRFEQPLMDNVLFDVRAGGTPDLGSVTPGAMGGHRGRYDLVVGNPPWTALKSKAGERLDQAAGKVAAEAIAGLRAAGRPDDTGGGWFGVDDPVEYRNPDHVPDLPFVWQSTLWARRDGVIALVLHGRLLFKTTPAAVLSRSLLFSRLRITGIVDGSDVSEAPAVWPGVTAPFCILFASNSPGDRSAAFHFASPLFEDHINRSGRFRLDPKRVHLVTPADLEEQPALLKLLSKGDALDLDVFRRMSGHGPGPDQAEPGLPSVTSAPLAAAGDPARRPAQDPKGAGRHAPGKSTHGGRVRWTTVGHYLAHTGMEHSTGFQTGNEGTRQPAPDIVALGGRELGGKNKTGFVIRPSALPKFERPELQWPRRPDIYLTPLLLVREAAKVDGDQPIASICFDTTPIIYTEAYTGWYVPGARPGGRHPDLGRFAAAMTYVGVIVCSPMLRYYQLLTSSKFGVERRAWNTFEIEDFPIPDPGDLEPEVQARFAGITSQVLEGLEPSRDELAAAAYGAYGMAEEDVQTIGDTLAVAQPTRESRSEAARQPSNDEVDLFCLSLQRVLAPMMRLVGVRLEVRRLTDTGAELSGWIFLKVWDQGRPERGQAGLPLDMAALVADEEGCSLVVDRTQGPGVLYVGMLSQKRFWLPSRARLLADEVMRAVESWKRGRLAG